VLWIIYAILNNLGFINEWTNGRLGTAKSTRRSTEQVIPSAPAVEAKPAEAAK